MTTPSRQEYEQARNTLDQIVRRAKSDPAFVQQLRTDPRQTLLAAGMPEGAIIDVMREEGMPAEVEGFKQCVFSCMTTNTCSLTINWG